MAMSEIVIELDDFLIHAILLPLSLHSMPRARGNTPVTAL
jgi:hypothetical protein